MDFKDEDAAQANVRDSSLSNDNGCRLKNPEFRRKFKQSVRNSASQAVSQDSIASNNVGARHSIKDLVQEVQENDGEKGRDTGRELKCTFVDANAMKEKVRQNLCKPQYSVRDFYKKSGIWQHMARSIMFEYVSLFVVAANAVWIAVDTDLNDSELLLEAHPIFQTAENLFCFCFFFEWLIRFMAFKKKRDGCRDAWFLFDTFMVWMMILETWAMNAFLLLAGAGQANDAGNASVLRIARLLRLSRMARMARLLRALPELMIMIRGMMAATRSVFFTLCLLIIVLYVFAIAFTQMCSHTGLGAKYFATVPESMFTLLIHGTLLDNVGTLSLQLGREQPHMAVMFAVFVLIAALTVMNMLIGVLCEVVNAVAATEKEEMLVTYVNQKLQKVVALLDTDGGGTISKKEFMQILENIDAVRCLQDVGVDVIGLVDFADFIFESDNTNEEGEVEEEEIELDFSKFMEVVLQLRGSNNATVKDIVDLRKFVRNSIIDMKVQLSRIVNHTEATKQAVRDKSIILADLDMNSRMQTPRVSCKGLLNSDQPASRLSLKSTVSEQISFGETTFVGSPKAMQASLYVQTDLIGADLKASITNASRFLAAADVATAPLQVRETLLSPLLREDADESEILKGPWREIDHAPEAANSNGIMDASHPKGVADAENLEMNSSSRSQGHPEKEIRRSPMSRTNSDLHRIEAIRRASFRRKQEEEEVLRRRSQDMAVTGVPRDLNSQSSDTEPAAGASLEQLRQEKLQHLLSEHADGKF